MPPQRFTLLSLSHPENLGSAQPVTIQETLVPCVEVEKSVRVVYGTPFHRAAANEGFEARSIA